MLLVVFLRLPSWCANEQGTGESSYLKTSFRLICQAFAVTRSLPKRSLSALTVIIFSSVAFTETFVDTELKILTLLFGMESQKDVVLELIFSSMKLFIWFWPLLVLFTSVSATSSGKTTPVAKLTKAPDSRENGLITRPEVKHDRSLLTSSSSRYTLAFVASLCMLSLLSFIP